MITNEKQAILRIDAEKLATYFYEVFLRHWHGQTGATIPEQIEIDDFFRQQVSQCLSQKAMNQAVDNEHLLRTRG